MLISSNNLSGCFFSNAMLSFRWRLHQTYLTRCMGTHFYKYSALRRKFAFHVCQESLQLVYVVSATFHSLTGDEVFQVSLPSGTNCHAASIAESTRAFFLLHGDTLDFSAGWELSISVLIHNFIHYYLGSSTNLLLGKILNGDPIYFLFEILPKPRNRAKRDPAIDVVST